MSFNNIKIISLVLLIASCSNIKEKEVSNSLSSESLKRYKNKTLQVYTTAKDTELRLTKTSEQVFKKKVQPLETEVAIFINPKKNISKIFRDWWSYYRCFIRSFCNAKRDATK